MQQDTPNLPYRTTYNNITSKMIPLVVEVANALDVARGAEEMLHYRPEAGPLLYSAIYVQTKQNPAGP